MTCVPYRRRQSTAPKSGAPKSVRSAAAGQSLDIDGIHLHLTRKPIKNLYLRIKPPSGRVEISAPMRMSESRIADFVKERHSWILAQQQRMAERLFTLAQRLHDLQQDLNRRGFVAMDPR